MCARALGCPGALCGRCRARRVSVQLVQWGCAAPEDHSFTTGRLAPPVWARLGTLGTSRVSGGSALSATCEKIIILTSLSLSLSISVFPSRLWALCLGCKYAIWIECTLRASETHTRPTSSSKVQSETGRPTRPAPPNQRSVPHPPMHPPHPASVPTHARTHPLPRSAQARIKHASITLLLVLDVLVELGDAALVREPHRLARGLDHAWSGLGLG